MPISKNHSKSTNLIHKKSFRVVLVTIFAFIAVFGISFITGNQQQSGVGNSSASALEPADINNDNTVNVLDLSYMLGKWKTTDTLADLNSDGTVNVLDLSRLLSKWGAVGGQPPVGDRVCPAFPQFPNESCTGVPSGTVLVPMNGYNVTTAGTIIDSMNITGTLNIDAPNVVIRNSRITATSWYGINVRTNGSLLIEDSEIIGSLAAGLNGANWTAKRIKIHSGTADNIKMASNTTLEDSMIYGLIPAEGAHADIIQVSGSDSGIVIRHNYLNAYNSVNDTFGTSALMIKTDFGTGSQGPLIIENNYIDGGGYSIYVRQVNGAYIANVSIMNNIFGTDYRYGSTSIDVPVSWSGNTKSGLPLEL